MSQPPSNHHQNPYQPPSSSSPPPHPPHQSQQYFQAPTYHQSPPPQPPPQLAPASQYGYPHTSFPPSHPQPMRVPPHVSSTGMWSSKLTLRLLSMIFCIVIVSIGAVVMSDIRQLDYYATSWDLYYSGYPGPILFLGPPVGVAFVWSLVESICICARGGHRGIHPGACIAIDLILWLGFIGGSVCVALYMPWMFNYSSIYQYPTATFALGIVQAAIHFALFVIACCETSRRNNQRSMTYTHNIHYGIGNVPPSGGAPPAMAAPYQPKEQASSVAQPVAAVPRRPTPSSASFVTPQPPAWDRQSGIRTESVSTPENSIPGYPPPTTSELPGAYQSTSKY